MQYNVLLDSSIMQKGLPATAGSRMLENFISPIDATVTSRLAAAGARITGRLDISEFGASGLFGDYATITEAVKIVLNDKTDAALFNDYTGAVSRAAAAQGLFYIHPTYGTVSRYGLIPAVTSMDQIGIVCKDLKTGFDVLKIIKGYDPKDGVMEKGEGRREKALESPRQLKIAEIEPIYSEIYTQVMQILCCAELGNNISRYDGIKFGHRAGEYNGLNELYTKSRSEAFGEDVKLAAIIGAMVLSQENYNMYYDKAMRLRRMIKESAEFDKYDVIKTSCPVFSRLNGLPSLTTPGHVYIADAGREDILEAIFDEV